MIKAIKQFFDEFLALEEKEEQQQHSIEIATAALLLETARADFQLEGEELGKIAEILRHFFDLDMEQTDALMELAQQQAQQATSYYEFTRLINDNYSPEQKIQIVEMMWRVAYADRYLEKYEEALIRKISDLLYVRHTDFIAAKHRVLEDLH
jgi:uncharacterized tellurite resistance protein B-like protein